MSRRDTQLYRDTEDQKIAGVCSGLARYFDVDPVLVRVLFVVFLFAGGGSLLAYLLLWWLVDPAPAGTWTEPASAVPPSAQHDAAATGASPTTGGDSDADPESAPGDQRVA